MKQTWKKITGLMLAVICTFALTACGKEETSAFQEFAGRWLQAACRFRRVR